MRPLRALFAVLVASSLAMATARGDEPTTAPVTPDPTEAAGAHVEPAKVRAWFAELADSDATVRDAAMIRLMGLPRADLPELLKAVEESLPLVPSQAAVLREIVTQVYLAGETYDASQQLGFLGIRMGQTSVSFRDSGNDPAARVISGVVVESRMTGFCAARMFRDGDVILGIVERPNVTLHEPSDFAMAVRDIGPHQSIHFEILRHGQILRVGLILDARPVEADQPLGMPELLEKRRLKSDEYWTRNFATLVKEGVS